MGLNSLRFIIQFVVLMIVLGALQIVKNRRPQSKVSAIQLLIILVFSYCFVLAADYRFALCVGIITVITYTCGLLAERSRTVPIFGIVLLISILFYFKYAGFFINEFGDLFGIQDLAIRVILPLGVSFYVFSGVSYLVDVYRGKYKHEKNLLIFALYMAFFPKLTAGPIVRYSDFKPQIEKYRGIIPANIYDGIQIFVFGLFKKNVLADHLGVFVDDVFRTPMAFSTGTVVLSAISYSLQIYLDFSGYSDMAIGISKILGIDIKRNFNLPYIAEDFSDFWNRWHISLSEWLKDYVYIPLGGSRKGIVRTYLNLVIVMLVSGMWHGAGWTFLLWGLLHGIASCVSRLLSRKSTGVHTAESSKKSNATERFAKMAVTYVLVTILWTVFRSDSIGGLLTYWQALFTIHNGISQPYTWSILSIVIVAASTIIAYFANNKNGGVINGFYPVMDLSKVWSLVILFTMIGLTIMLGYYGNTAFIYGGF